MTAVTDGLATAATTRAGKRTGPGAARRRERWTAAVFLAPDLLGLLIFLVLPMVLCVVLGFFRVDGLGRYDFIGFDNYVRMVSDPQFWSSLR
ncbi:MAG: sugar ABC transporter permease, partial [Kutzneria sp.]|nr:sugar ABC transporter permease [Kutzneria sp.]